MATAAGTPNIDAALDAGSAIAAGALTEEPEEHLSDLDILNQEDAPATETPTTETPAAAQPVDGAAPAGEPAKAPEQTEAEKTAAAAKAEEEKAQLAPADKAVKDLRDSIEKDPAVKAALDANPALRDQIWRNARLAQDTEAYRAEFATPTIAHQAKLDAEDLVQIETNYFSGTQEGHDSLLKRFWEADIVRDAKGEPIKDGAGNAQSKGNYDKFFFHYRETQFYPAVLELAKREGKDAEVGEALQVLREFLGEVGPDGNPPAKKPPQAVVEDNSRLTPEEKAALAEHASLKRQQAQADDSTAQAYQSSVREAVDKSSNEFLLKRAASIAPALSPNLQKKLASDTFAEIQKIARADGALGRLRDGILRGRDEDGKTRWVGEVRRYIESRYRTIMERLAAEYSEPVVNQTADTRKKLDQQAARKEVQGGAGVPTPSTPADDTAANVREGDELMQRIHGRKLSSTEIFEIEDLLPSLRLQAARYPKPAAKK